MKAIGNDLIEITGKELHFLIGANLSYSLLLLGRDLVESLRHEPELYQRLAEPWDKAIHQISASYDANPTIFMEEAVAHVKLQAEKILSKQGKMG